MKRQIIYENYENNLKVYGYADRTVLIEGGDANGEIDLLTCDEAVKFGRAIANHAYLGTTTAWVGGPQIVG